MSGQSTLSRLLVDGEDVCEVTVAASFAERCRGLLGRDGISGALWLRRTTSVHTFGMRFAIDVVHLDRAGRVLGVITQPPGRLGAPRRRARSVVELAAGQAERFGIRPGTVLGMARADRGTTTVEYVGVMAVVAVVISSVLLTPIGGSLRHGLAAAFCTVAGHDGCDVGSFVDGTVDPNDVRNRAPERCVVHSDSTDLNVELGLGRFAFVGESGRMLREIRSDGSIAVTLLGDLSGGGGVGGEGGAKVDRAGAALGASAQVGLRFGGGGTWEFADSAAADAFEAWAAQHLTGDPVNGLIAGRLGEMLGVEDHIPSVPRRLEIQAGADLSATLRLVGGIDPSLLIGAIGGVQAQVLADLGVAETVGLTIDLDARTITAHVDGRLAGQLVEPGVDAGLEVEQSVGLVYGFDAVLQRLDVDRAVPVDVGDVGDMSAAGSLGELISVLGSGGHLGSESHDADREVIGQVHAELDLGDAENRAALDAVVGAMVSVDRQADLTAAVNELAFRINADGRISATTVSASEMSCSGSG